MSTSHIHTHIFEKSLISSLVVWLSSSFLHTDEKSHILLRPSLLSSPLEQLNSTWSGILACCSCLCQGAGIIQGYKCLVSSWKRFIWSVHTFVLLMIFTQSCLRSHIIGTEERGVSCETLHHFILQISPTSLCNYAQYYDQLMAELISTHFSSTFSPGKQKKIDERIWITNIEMLLVSQTFDLLSQKLWHRELEW